MSDPNFYQTVVLILEHNDEGAFGLVVNRRSHLTLGDIIPRFATNTGYSTPIHVGGPVQQEYLFTLHSELPEESVSESKRQAITGVFFEPSFQNLEKYFEEDYLLDIPADDRPRIHLFLGYSGWGPHQLEKEMDLGSWIIHPANSRIVFHTNSRARLEGCIARKGRHLSRLRRFQSESWIELSLHG